MGGGVFYAQHRSLVPLLHGKLVASGNVYICPQCRILPRRSCHPWSVDAACWIIRLLSAFPGMGFIYHKAFLLCSTLKESTVTRSCFGCLQLSRDMQTGYILKDFKFMNTAHHRASQQLFCFPTIHNKHSNKTNTQTRFSVLQPAKY